MWLQCDGEEAKLLRHLLLIAATKSGASGLAERAPMMSFRLCLCWATWCQPRVVADGPLGHPPCQIENHLFDTAKTTGWRRHQLSISDWEAAKASCRDSVGYAHSFPTFWHHPSHCIKWMVNTHSFGAIRLEPRPEDPIDCTIDTSSKDSTDIWPGNVVVCLFVCL